MKSITAIGAASVLTLVLASAAQASVPPNAARPMISLPIQSRAQADVSAVIRAGALARATSLFAANMPTVAAAKPKANRKITPVAFTPGPFEALDNPAVSFSRVGSRGSVGR